MEACFGPLSFSTGGCPPRQASFPATEAGIRRRLRVPDSHLRLVESKQRQPHPGIYMIYYARLLLASTMKFSKEHPNGRINEAIKVNTLILNELYVIFKLRNQSGLINETNLYSLLISNVNLGFLSITSF